MPEVSFFVRLGGEVVSIIETQMGKAVGTHADHLIAMARKVHNGKATEIALVYSWSQGTDGLALLLEGRHISRQLGRDQWDFAVELSELLSSGLSRNALRWLLREQYVHHATELDAGVGECRNFIFDSSVERLRFAEQSCFVLTDDGISFVSQLLEDSHRPEGIGVPTLAAQDTLTTPKWDCLGQELRLGDVVVKRFKVRAPNQERVLSAFEEEGWPACIDDPLPRSAELNPKRRLHETINSLNRNQKRRMIRFMGNGKGEGVAWELA